MYLFKGLLVVMKEIDHVNIRDLYVSYKYLTIYVITYDQTSDMNGR